MAPRIILTIFRLTNIWKYIIELLWDTPYKINCGSVDIIPPKKGKSVNKQNGNKVDTEYLPNLWIFLEPDFVGR